MRKLFLDVETRPSIVHAWSLFDLRVGTQQIVEPGSTICWAAKWADEKEIMFDSVHQSKPLAMFKRIHKLISEADAVIHYNGTRFDMPVLNKEFVVHGLAPPAPYKNIDLLRTARQQFKFLSNKMDFVSQHLGLEGKTAHKGHALWVGCMENDPASWKIMRRYNIQDVKILEKLYYRLLPWIKGHPNHSLYDPQDVPSCTNCGSANLQSRGYAFTQTLRYRRHVCNDCGSWGRSRASERLDEDLRDSITVKAN